MVAPEPAFNGVQPVKSPVPKPGFTIKFCANTVFPIKSPARLARPVMVFIVIFIFRPFFLWLDLASGSALLVVLNLMSYFVSQQKNCVNRCFTFLPTPWIGFIEPDWRSMALNHNICMAFLW